MQERQYVGDAWRVILQAAVKDYRSKQAAKTAAAGTQTQMAATA